MSPVEHDWFILKIFGVFLTLKVWWISSTFNDRFNGATVKHVQRINNIFRLILHNIYCQDSLATAIWRCKMEGPVSALLPDGVAAAAPGCPAHLSDQPPGAVRSEDSQWTREQCGGQPALLPGCPPLEHDNHGVQAKESSGIKGAHLNFFIW